jgi:sodium-dependent phosphate cotransporter
MKKAFYIGSRLLLVGVLLYLFLVSIGLMGAAFKGFGKGFAENLVRTTSNPFVGLFVGILATSLVQSSSTTTSIVVGMVGSGVITVSSGVYIVMGANIGTTVTNTLVSLGHFTRRDEFRRAVGAATVHDFFNFICVCVLFPLELATGALEKLAVLMGTLFKDVGGIKFTSPIKLATNPAVHSIRDLIVKTTEAFSSTNTYAYILVLILSILMLFLSLYFLVRCIRSLIIKRAEIILDNVIARSKLLGLVAGLVFTIIVQSSSVTTSLLVPLVAAGVITVESAFSVTMGANIGTTTTCILASFATGNISAIVVAFEHFLFNTIGVLMIFPMKAIRMIPINLALAFGNLAAKKRGYALVYVLAVFFVVPALLIFISKYI